MNYWLLWVVMIGPPSPPALSLTVHLGNDHRSRIAYHELTCQHEFWQEQRLAVNLCYQLKWDENSYNYPTYQIGRGPKEEFPKGAFAASGSFVKTLRSIAETDKWARANPQAHWEANDIGIWSAKSHAELKPEPFPPIIGE